MLHLYWVFLYIKLALSIGVAWCKNPMWANCHSEFFNTPIPCISGMHLKTDSQSPSKQVIYKDVPKVENERICPVCTDEAPPDEIHHPHYGAICCYGCKAFFRRAHQKTRAPAYKCKRGIWTMSLKVITLKFYFKYNLQGIMVI